MHLLGEVVNSLSGEVCREPSSAKKSGGVPSFPAHTQSLVKFWLSRLSLPSHSPPVLPQLFVISSLAINNGVIRSSLC